MSIHEKIEQAIVAQRHVDQGNEPSSYAIAIQDASGHFLFVNSGLAQLFRCRVEQLVGLSVVELVSDSMRPAVERELARFQRGDITARIIEFERCDYNTFAGIVYFQEIVDEDGGHLGGIFSMFDLSVIYSGRHVGRSSEESLRRQLEQIAHAVGLMATDRSEEQERSLFVDWAHPELKAVTEREREVLGMIVEQHAGIATIANRLQVTEGTVRGHIRSLNEKFKVANREALIKFVRNL